MPRPLRASSNNISAELVGYNVDSVFTFQERVHEIHSKLPAYYKFKIFFEIVAAAFLLILLFVPMSIIAAVIFVKYGGPVIYKHRRVGFSGQIFDVYKFRTLKRDAPRVESLGYAPLYKIKKDPRVEGGFGRLLRKFKLDELPQLINVLKGEMLLIGPRPYPVVENLMMNCKSVNRFAVRPGISGKWQVLDNHISDPIMREDLDNQYVVELSFFNDLKIFIYTLKVVITGCNDS